MVPEVPFSDPCTTDHTCKELAPGLIPPMKYINPRNEAVNWRIKSRVNSLERLFWIKMVVLRCINETIVKWWHPLTYLSTWPEPPRRTSPVLTLGYVCSLSSVRRRTQRVVHKLLGLKPIYTTLPKALGRLSCYTFTGFPCLSLAASRALRRCCHNSFLHARYRSTRQTFGPAATQKHSHYVCEN